MVSLSDFQVFLFDFDGLLVNTEELHYLAYMKLCNQRGYHFPLDFATYLKHALFTAEALKPVIYQANPGLEEKGPSWKELYLEKKRIFQTILDEKKVDLMEGVEELLTFLQKKNLRRAIVTNSTRLEVERIRHQNPILSTIPHLITREDYTHPKPSPESYEKAISLLATPLDRIIGFEDSPRGLQALLGTRAEGVFVSSIFSKDEIEKVHQRDFFYTKSLSQLDL